MTQDNTSHAAHGTAPDATANAAGNGGDLFNTAAGWVLFAGIVGLGLSVLSSKYFHGYNPERPEKLGYVIEGAEEEGGDKEGPDLATLLASATPEAGAKVFAKCQSCHSIEQGGKNGIGPNLWAIMGKPVGKSVAGFGYSPALSGKGGEWTWENMNAWLTSPAAFAKGTVMSFNGLNKPEDRANLMAYLEANGGAPARPVAKAAPEAEAEAGAEGEEKAEAGAEPETAETPAADAAQTGAEAKPAADKPAE